MKSFEYWPAALAHLSSVDPVMTGLIARVTGVELQPDRFGNHFEAIVRAIIFQQISGHAGRSIYNKFSTLFPDNHPVPLLLRTKTPDELRAAGVSPQKAGYLIDLAAKCDDRTVHVERLHELPDSQIIEELTSVKGIGVWTAQMFLIFRLARPDVLPDLDLGIRKGIQLAYGLAALPKSPQVQEIGACWAPYRTVASLYLWRSLDVQTPA